MRIFSSSSHRQCCVIFFLITLTGIWNSFLLVSCVPSKSENVTSLFSSSNGEAVWKRQEHSKTKNGTDLMRNRDFVKLIQKQRVETESEMEGETEDETEGQIPNVPSQTERPQPLIIKSHPILTSSSLTSGAIQNVLAHHNNQNNKIGTIHKKQQQIPQELSSSIPTEIHQHQHQHQQEHEHPDTDPDIPIAAPNTNQHHIHNHNHKPTMMIASYQQTLQASSQTPNPNSDLKSQFDDLFAKVTSFPQPAPVQLPQISLPPTDGILHGFQKIKDAYFEVLEKLRDFRNTVSKRFEMVENEIQEVTRKLNKTISQPPTIVPHSNPAQEEELILNVQKMYTKMNEMERRFNISRLVDHAVHFLLGSNLQEAFAHWTKLEMLTAPNVSETNQLLAEIVKLTYARNSSNTSPVFPFLRKLHGVEKIPIYDSLINGMKARDDFDGVEIFHIAQYLKERNAVRSSIYSKIPKAVQYAVSGRNVNIVYFEKKRGRNYLHVRDDQNRKDRLNFYIQASQSYTDSRSAVWNIAFESGSETFKIRNALYGDYMYINEEGFLETVTANTATTMGTEFNFILMKEKIMIQSKTYTAEPLVVVRGGGKYPYYFSLMRENPHAVIAEFLIEPDTLL